MRAVVTHLKKPVDEMTARRAVDGADAEIMKQVSGIPAKEAEAVSNALELYLVGDDDGARRELLKVYVNGTVDEVLAEFGKIEADADVANAA